MKKELYDVIEDLDILRLELLYQFKANKGFIESELRDVYSKDSDFLSLMSGIEYTQQGLLNRFEKISSELSEIMKCK